MNERIDLYRRRLCGGQLHGTCSRPVYFIEADTLEALRQNIREAVDCHFNDSQAPISIRICHKSCRRETEK